MKIERYRGKTFDEVNCGDVFVFGSRLCMKCYKYVSPTDKFCMVDLESGELFCPDGDVNVDPINMKVVRDE